jgi:hypothetical protein
MRTSIHADPGPQHWIILRMEDGIIPSAWKTCQVTHTCVVGCHLGVTKLVVSMRLASHMIFNYFSSLPFLVA